MPFTHLEQQQVGNNQISCSLSKQFFFNSLLFYKVSPTYVYTVLPSSREILYFVCKAGSRPTVQVHSYSCNRSCLCLICVLSDLFYFWKQMSRKGPFSQAQGTKFTFLPVIFVRRFILYSQIGFPAGQPVGKRGVPLCLCYFQPNPRSVAKYSCPTTSHNLS